MTADGLTYSDKSFTLAGLKRNHHYTMSVPCNSKTVTIGVPDAVDKKSSRRQICWKSAFSCSKSANGGLRISFSTASSVRSEEHTSELQ